MGVIFAPKATSSLLRVLTRKLASPITDVVFPVADDIQEQQKNDGTDGIAINVDHSAEHDHRPADGQQMIQLVLGDQAEHQRADDQHDPFLPLLNIGIDPDSDQQARQQKHHRKDGEDLCIMRRIRRYCTSCMFRHPPSKVFWQEHYIRSPG